MNGKKALLVAEYYPPAPGPATARIGSFSRFLPEFGWSPLVLTPAEARTVGLGPVAAERDGGCRRRMERDSTGPSAGTRVHYVVSRLPRSIARILDASFLASRALPLLLRSTLTDAWAVDWFCSALLAVLDAAEREHPHVIYATAPPVTGLFAAALAARRLGTPLVLDFRDLWCDNPGYMAPPPVAAVHRRSERWLLRSASRVVVNTRGALDLLRARHSAVPGLDRKLWVIPNGFHGGDFGFRISDSKADKDAQDRQDEGTGCSGVQVFRYSGQIKRGVPEHRMVSSCRSLLTSECEIRNPESEIRDCRGPFRLRFVGKLYGEFGRTYWDTDLVGRRGLSGWRAPAKGELMPAALGCLNPVGVLEAARDLLDAGKLELGELVIEFIGHYGTGNARLAWELGLGELVAFRGTVDTQTALTAVRSADALLLISSGAEQVVPAKTYEYLAAAKPLLVIAPPGDLKRLLRLSGVTWFEAQIEDRDSVRTALAELLEFLRSGAPARAAEPKCLARYERRRLAGRLARVLDEACGARSAECGARSTDCDGPDLHDVPHSARRAPHCGGVV